VRPFDSLAAVAAPLALANIDTDKILPGRYLKTVSKIGLGPKLFASMRYDDQGRERDDFVLNNAPWRHAKILIALENFGCGSSREHAPWALVDFGIRCIIAPSFADIFHANCFKNGILPIALSGGPFDLLMADAAHPATASMAIDLAGQTIRRTNGETITFDISLEGKQMLLLGQSDIETSLLSAGHIADWETARSHPCPAIPDDIAAFG
jgi:3-isopropylmalate/(R)-2-methylmalate dehydratase small subunit